tara:strand:+ start:690 stop:1379 length:690 start_codon:yes stop_codon:yes gene_type:complete
MARYNPMQSVVGQAGLQLSGQGLAWEGKQRGLGREAIQSYLNKQARAATAAGRGIGLANLVGKGAGLLTMLATGGNVAAGAAVSGGISGFGGKHFADKLSKEGAPDVLYGVSEAEEAESYAHQAIDNLIGSVAPKALSTAITTPLMYHTLENVFGGVPGGESGVATGLPNVSTEAASMAKEQALLGGEQSLASYLDPQNLQFSTLGDERKALGRMGTQDFFESRFQGVY